MDGVRDRMYGPVKEQFDGPEGLAIERLKCLSPVKGADRAYAMGITAEANLLGLAKVDPTLKERMDRQAELTNCPRIGFIHNTCWPSVQLNLASIGVGQGGSQENDGERRSSWKEKGKEKGSLKSIGQFGGPHLDGRDHEIFPTAMKNWSKCDENIAPEYFTIYELGWVWRLEEYSTRRARRNPERDPTKEDGQKKKTEGLEGKPRKKGRKGKKQVKEKGSSGSNNRNGYGADVSNDENSDDEDDGEDWLELGTGGNRGGTMGQNAGLGPINLNESNEGKMPPPPPLHVLPLVRYLTRDSLEEQVEVLKDAANIPSIPTKLPPVGTSLPNLMPGHFDATHAGVGSTGVHEGGGSEKSSPVLWL
ncbi:hypothetical protein C8R42DRAFT_727320 [Lentinula raphanica]|nr:hypothetical protein C8R42DRAFT_727320 [Lentinula raphanica]